MSSINADRSQQWPFLRAILDDYESDVPRLIYADWLEERGDPRAEFIRVQCELAQLTKRETKQILSRNWNFSFSAKPQNLSQGEVERKSFLESKERELETRCRSSWLTGLRGLLPEVDDPLKVFVQFQRGLLTHLQVSNVSVGGGKLAILEQFPEITHIYFGDTGIGDDDLKDLSRLPYLRYVSFEPEASLTGRGISSLAELRNLVQITHSYEQGHLVEPINEVKRHRLAQYRQLSSDGQRRFAKMAVSTLAGPRVCEDAHGGVNGLSFAQSRFADIDLTYVLGLPELEFLDIFENRITDGGLAMLQGLPNLRFLVISNNFGITDLSPLRSLPLLEQLFALVEGLTEAACRVVLELKNLKRVLLSYEVSEEFFLELRTRGIEVLN
jgi:uncharacterized protein (TIGR02996 family)